MTQIFLSHLQPTIRADLNREGATVELPRGGTAPCAAAEWGCCVPAEAAGPPPGSLSPRGSLSCQGNPAGSGIESRARNCPAFEAAFALKRLAVNKRNGSNNTGVLQSERRLPLHLSSATHAVSVLIPAPKGTCNYEPPSSPPARVLLFETLTEEGYLDCE